MSAHSRDDLGRLHPVQTTLARYKGGGLMEVGNIATRRYSRAIV